MLLDPDLKVRISTGRWEPEGGRGGSIYVEMHYDPELRPDRLTMPTPATLVESMEMFGNPAPSEVAFKSPVSRKVAELIFDVESIDDEIALLHPGPAMRPSFGSLATLIARADAGPLSEHPYAALLYMVEAVPMLPIWERDYGKDWGAKWVSVYIHKTLAAELAREAELPNLTERDDLVRIARREIES
jgi:hypothetical protein